jgi:hypothetical protein
MKRLFLLGLIFVFATFAHAQTASGPIYQMGDLRRLGDQTFAGPTYLIGQFIYMGEFQGKQMFRNFTILPGHHGGVPFENIALGQDIMAVRFHDNFPGNLKVGSILAPNKEAPLQLERIHRKEDGSVLILADNWNK